MLSVPRARALLELVRHMDHAFCAPFSEWQGMPVYRMLEDCPNTTLGGGTGPAYEARL